VADSWVIDVDVASIVGAMDGGSDSVDSKDRVSELVGDS